MTTKGRILAGLAALTVGCALAPAWAQDTPAATPPAPPPGFMRSEPLGAGPWDFDTAEGKVHAEVVARLDRPWSLAFLPGGGMLVTERAGRSIADHLHNRQCSVNRYRRLARRLTDLC